ncbi:hypothetical protein PENTCL1PPCAC_2763, partial [Pristionchus entomophagus]
SYSRMDSPIDKEKSLQELADLSAAPEQKRKRGGVLRSLSFQFSNIAVRSHKKGEVDPTYDHTPEKDYEELGPMGVQNFGTMMKKYNKKNRPAKWTKRFFILKECFLLYYPSSFKKTFEKTKRIDLHPKGVIPLIGCSIVSGGDVGRRHCLLIAHPQFPSAVIVSAPDAGAQDAWLAALRRATKISYKNTMVGETMIRELESKGNMLNEEKRNYERNVHDCIEGKTLTDFSCQELGRLKEELEEEREKLIRTTKKLKDDLQNVKNELKLTNETKRTLEQEKIALNTKTEHLALNMASLNIEKEKIEDQLSTMVKEREQYIIEKQNLSTAACQLKNRLMEIETNRNCMSTEKEKIAKLLEMNEQKMADLEKERHYYTTQTNRLMETLKVTSAEKDETEAELREQLQARIGAEKQLHAAEKALEHLENALRLTGAQMSELQEHIMPDVHKLREFFEKVAEEAKAEANSVGILRSAIGARKSMRRSMRRVVGRSSMRKTRITSDVDDGNNNNMSSVC